jgi:hypothetical protein
MPPLWFVLVGCGIVKITVSVGSATFGSGDTLYSAMTSVPSPARV